MHVTRYFCLVSLYKFFRFVHFRPHPLRLYGLDLYTIECLPCNLSWAVYDEQLSWFFCVTQSHFLLFACQWNIFTDAGYPVFPIVYGDELCFCLCFTQMLKLKKTWASSLTNILHCVVANYPWTPIFYHSIKLCFQDMIIDTRTDRDLSIFRNFPYI